MLEVLVVYHNVPVPRAKSGRHRYSLNNNVYFYRSAMSAKLMLEVSVVYHNVPVPRAKSGRHR